MTVSSPPLVLSGNHQLGSEVSRGGGGSFLSSSLLCPAQVERAWRGV